MLSRFAALAILAGTAVTLTAQSPVSFESSGQYQNGAIAAGDFNSDGAPDMIQNCSSSYPVCGNSTNSLVFFAGNGDGTFRAPVLAATMPQQGANSFITADFNGDGRLDLAAVSGPTSNGGPMYLLVWYGNGNGTFQAPIKYVLSELNAYNVVSGEFFGDGHPDIAVGELNGVIDLFRNQGSSFVFDKSINLGTGSGSEVYSLTSGDLNGTGVSEIAASAEGGSASSGEAYVLWNDGKGNFTQQDLGSYVNPAVNISRLNGDAMMDLLVGYTCNPQQTGVQAGHMPPYNACAGFDVYYGQGNNKLFKRTVVTDPGVYSPDSNSLMGADVNGDGYGDIIAASALSGYSQFGVFVWLGNADGTFQQTPEEFIVSSGGAGSFVSADFNRDGMMDFTESNEIFLNSTVRPACGTYTISPSVTECQPVDNTYSPSPVRVEANSFDTTKVTAMQEYVDGSLQYSQPVTSFNTTFPTSLGTHFFVTKAWDASGRSFVADRTVTVYNGMPGPVCPAATDSTNICLPPNASSSAPVTIVANGNSGTVVPTAAQLYIDGTLAVNNQNSSYVQTSQNLSSGMHQLVFKLWDASGDVYTAQKTITVQ